MDGAIESDGVIKFGVRKKQPYSQALLCGSTVGQTVMAGLVRPSTMFCENVDARHISRSRASHFGGHDVCA
jgi:hypothetical protein